MFVDSTKEMRTTNVLLQQDGSSKQASRKWQSVKWVDKHEEAFL